MRVPRLHFHMGHWLLLSRLLLGVETLFVVDLNDVTAVRNKLHHLYIVQTQTQRQRQ